MWVPMAEEKIEVNKMQNAISTPGKLKIHFSSDKTGCFDCYICEENKEHDYYEIVQSNTFQYLQSRGYALPYLSYTVEELIEMGIYIIEEKA